MHEIERHFENQSLKLEIIVSLIAAEITNQQQFNILFGYLKNENLIWTRFTIAAIEYITRKNPEYLAKQENKLLKLAEETTDWEFKLHLAPVLSRLHLTPENETSVFVKLSNWIFDKEEFEPVRINSLKGLYELVKKNSKFIKAFELLCLKVKSENTVLLNDVLQDIIQP